MDLTTNPIFTLLEWAKYDPQVMESVEMIIDSCFQQARAYALCDSLLTFRSKVASSYSKTTPLSTHLKYDYDSGNLMRVHFDLAVFGLPFAGSINQFLIISGRLQGSTAKEGNAGIFSFAVIFIFLHFLFELRISRTVCQFVTVIIRIISQIRIFFFIFTVGILAFTIATLHILRACPFKECSDPSTKLPSKFFYALSATYFFMGGRYDAVNDDFNSENWQFHLMMMIYFFFTVILMLNVLIALINVAFSVGDGTWRLVWFLNRLQVIESAENLSYDVPGFRQSSSWFPKEIYYLASRKQVRAYEKTYPIDGGQDVIMAEDPSQSDQKDPLTLLRLQQETLQKEMENLRDRSQGQNDTLREQNLELKRQLGQLQESFAAQTSDMRALITELLAPGSL
ncbi:hypothetical protein BGZ70_004284 [Mortierella alpina]|uniref:Ion transport domain-containing protein n=1 Tax=Mortierella alpina TaxID=64518 RepID=A0A9P6JA60_MORAP|nr:hypothetical protein BGZ70_004284 [Mortierella alpina]